jgi:hypothetical protein
MTRDQIWRGGISWRFGWWILHKCFELNQWLPPSRERSKQANKTKFIYEILHEISHVCNFSLTTCKKKRREQKANTHMPCHGERSKNIGKFQFQQNPENWCKLFYLLSHSRKKWNGKVSQSLFSFTKNILSCKVFITSNNKLSITFLWGGAEKGRM